MYERPLLRTRGTHDTLVPWRNHGNNAHPAPDRWRLWCHSITMQLPQEMYERPLLRTRGTHDTLVPVVLLLVVLLVSWAFTANITARVCMLWCFPGRLQWPYYLHTKHTVKTSKYLPVYSTTDTAVFIHSQLCGALVSVPIDLDTSCCGMQNRIHQALQVQLSSHGCRHCGGGPKALHWFCFNTSINSHIKCTSTLHQRVH